ncbi:MAG: hypothetical protein ACYYK0_01060 [Candidatus Eutrophobiaceae bacterium]
MSMETVNPVLQGHWRDYLALCGWKVVSLIVFTAGGAAGCAYGLPPLDLLFFACLGIALAAASAAVVSHVVDRRIDFADGTHPAPSLATGQEHSSGHCFLFHVAGCPVHSHPCLLGQYADRYAHLALAGGAAALSIRCF